MPAISKEDGGRGFLDATVDEATIRAAFARATLRKPGADAVVYVGTINWFGIEIPVEVRRVADGVELVAFHRASALPDEFPP